MYWTDTQNSVSHIGPTVIGLLSDETPEISQDGRFLVYLRKLTEGETAVAIRDLETGSEEMIVSDVTGRNVSGLAFSISADGRYIGFQTTMDELTVGTLTHPIAVRYDRITKALEIVNKDSSGEVIPAIPGGNIGLNQPLLSSGGESFVWHRGSSELHLGTLSTEHRVNVISGEVQSADFGNLHVGPLFDEIADVTLDEDQDLVVNFTGAYTDLPAGSVHFQGTVFLFVPELVDRHTINQVYVPGGSIPIGVPLVATVSLVDNAVSEMRYKARMEHNGRFTEQNFTVTWVPVNDAPVLDTSVNLSLPPTAPGSSDNGVLVKTLLNSNALATPIMDVDEDALQGIAVTGFDDTAGIWQYSIDDGSTWITFPIPNLFANATLLAADDQTRIRLLSTPDSTGTSEIFFRAWDQTTGINGGSASILTAADAGATTAFSTAISSATIAVIVPDTDGDGIADSIEDAAPNGGDGNRDGIRDRAQANVSSLTNAVDGTYVTVVAPSATSLIGVTATANPTLDGDLNGFQSPIGIINYEIHGVRIGETIDVTLILHNDARLTNYFKYGPTPGNSKPHFYAFEKTSDYGIQRLKNGEVTLRFTDGLIGDDDLTANGVIVDPGVPVKQTHGAAQNPIEPSDVNNDDQTSALDALLVVNELSRLGQKDQNTFERNSDFFFDVNGDRSVSALDALLVINSIARHAFAIESAQTTLAEPEASQVDQWMADEMATPTSSDLGNPVDIARSALKPVSELSTTLTTNTDGERSKKREKKYESAVEHWIGGSLF